MAKQYYILFYAGDDGVGGKKPYMPNTTIFTGPELRKFVSGNGMRPDWRIASVQEVTFTVTRTQQTVDVDDLAIGQIAP